MNDNFGISENVLRLMSLFEDSYVNSSNELILIPRTNLYFRLDNVKTIEDLCYKIIAWCSRDASKTEPFHSRQRNEQYRAVVRNKLNKFLGVDLTEDNWMVLYTHFGNGVNELECREFIKTNILGVKDGKN